MGKRSRRRRHRSGKVEASLDDPGDWVVIAGGRCFVAGYTPGGVPYGCFEDEFVESPQRNVEAPLVAGSVCWASGLPRRDHRAL